MSFEIIDNTFQVIVLAAMALLAFILAFRRSSRSCLILAFGYASFMMGTLYYLLHLIILGHGPQVFYVAECSWMASYFFFLSLEILYWEGLRPPFSPFALAAGVVFAGVVMRVQVFGPSPLMSGAPPHTQASSKAGTSNQLHSLRSLSVFDSRHCIPAVSGACSGSFHRSGRVRLGAAAQRR